MENDLLRRRLGLFPISTHVDERNRNKSLALAGCDLSDLAERYDTPLYLYDRHTLDVSLSEYRMALLKYYPSTSGITYAGKAYLCIALAQWCRMHSLGLDCSSPVEVAVARAGGLPREQIILHGVNKNTADLQCGLQYAGTIVVDHLTELIELISLRRQFSDSVPYLWLRLRPGLTVDTHAYTQTGRIDSKFGMDTAEASEVVQLCLREGLALTGVHFHLGSHFTDPSPLEHALSIGLDFIQDQNKTTGWTPKILCPGGGWGVAYHEDDLPQPSIAAYVKFIAEMLIKGCNRRNLPLPHLQIEPGRSLVARAGIAIYRVGAIKSTPGRRWLLLDGGIADNPRPALYNSRYSALPVSAPDRPAIIPTWLGGKYCESGDTLIEGLLLPEISTGELLAIPVSGAYQLSMSSNYNGALKPAVIWVDGGQAQLIQRRQILEDILGLEIGLDQ